MAVTPYERRDFEGAAKTTTITSQITSTALSITITDATGWPDGSPGPFYVVIDPDTSTEEKIRVTSRSGTSLTVANVNDRGTEGTAAASHSAGATIKHVFTKQDADEANYVVTQTVGKVTTAEDLLVASGANAFKRLAKGTNNQVLTVVSGVLAWQTPSSTPTFGLGIQGYTAVSSAQSSISSITDLTGGSVAVNPGTNRRVRIRIQGMFTKSSTSGDVTIYIREGSTIIEKATSRFDANDTLTLNLESYPIISGAHTYKFSAAASAGTVASVVDADTNPYIVVVDEGSG